MVHQYGGKLLSVQNFLSSCYIAK
uniref:Uncharacterized protein n=1 Tax=Arundo donax TaxID=35708 RepID=A0A0A9GT88_ARUDO